MNGRTAKRLRREGVRPRKVVEHIPVDNGADYTFNAELYRERRKRGLRGMIQAPREYETVDDGKGSKVRIPKR